MSRRWPWTRYLPALAMVYAGVTFATTIVLSDGGVPQERDGRWVLASRGRFVRELTREEFRWHEALDSRLWTAAWMCFYLCFALHLAGASDEASGNSTPQEG